MKSPIIAALITAAIAACAPDEPPAPPCTPATIRVGTCTVVCADDGWAFGTCDNQAICIVLHQGEYAEVVNLGGNVPEEGGPWSAWGCPLGL
jgi:hypothetical protein